MNNILDKLRKKSLDKIYVAEVKDNAVQINDKRYGGIRIHISPFTDGIDNNDLPIAYPFLNSTSENNILFDLPEVGSFVWIIFEDKDDILTPLYGGGVINDNIESYLASKRDNDYTKTLYLKKGDFDLEVGDKKVEISYTNNFKLTLNRRMEW